VGVENVGLGEKEEEAEFDVQLDVRN